MIAETVTAAVLLFVYLDTDGEVVLLPKYGSVYYSSKRECEDAISRLDEDEKNTVGLTDGTPGNPNIINPDVGGRGTLIISEEGSNPFATLGGTQQLHCPRQASQEKKQKMSLRRLTSRVKPAR